MLLDAVDGYNDNDEGFVFITKMLGIRSVVISNFLTLFVSKTEELGPCLASVVGKCHGWTALFPKEVTWVKQHGGEQRTSRYLGMLVDRGRIA